VASKYFGQDLHLGLLSVGGVMKKNRPWNTREKGGQGSAWFLLGQALCEKTTPKD